MTYFPDFGGIFSGSLSINVVGAGVVFVWGGDDYDS